MKAVVLACLVALLCAPPIQPCWQHCWQHCCRQGCCTRHLNQAGFRHPASQEPYLATLTVQAPHVQYLSRLPCEKSSSSSDSFLFFTVLPHFLVVPTPPLEGRARGSGSGRSPNPHRDSLSRLGPPGQPWRMEWCARRPLARLSWAPLRLFRGGQRALPRARRRGGRGLSRHELVERALPTPAREQSLKPLREACTQLSALARAGGRHSEVLEKGEALQDAVLSMLLGAGSFPAARALRRHPESASQGEGAGCQRGTEGQTSHVVYVARGERGHFSASGL